MTEDDEARGRVVVNTVSDKQAVHALARRLLDGEEPVDPSVARVVDDALRGRSADPALHGAALLVAYSTDRDLRLSRSHSRGWVPGLQELIHGGHLEAAGYALPRLKAAFPRMPFLDYMAFVFERLPSAVDNGREIFVDDRTSDVQVVSKSGADTVILAFCGASNQLGIAINLIDRWFARLDAHLIYLRDRKKIGYTAGVPALGPDVDGTIERLRELVASTGARRIVCVGNSAGATGALRYASRLGTERVLALAPITGGPAYAKKVLPHLPPGKPRWWGDLVPLYRKGLGVRVHIMYGEQNAGDGQQSRRMAGLPGVTVEALPDWDSHHLVGGILRAGRLERVLDWLVLGDGVIDLGMPIPAAVAAPTGPAEPSN